jgi:hypothetical protein
LSPTKGQGYALAILPKGEKIIVNVDFYFFQFEKGQAIQSADSQ